MRYEYAHVGAISSLGPFFLWCQSFGPAVLRSVLCRGRQPKEGSSKRGTKPQKQSEFRSGPSVSQIKRLCDAEMACTVGRWVRSLGRYQLSETKLAIKPVRLEMVDFGSSRRRCSQCYTTDRAVCH